MMKPFKSTIRCIVAAALIVGMMAGRTALAQKPEDEKGKNLAKETYDPFRYTCLNINNLWTWQREDGHTNHSPTGQDGCFSPRRTSHVIYQDAFNWGAKCYLDAAKTRPAPFGQIIRVNGGSYGTGCREGWINGFGANAVQVSKDDPLARVYRIRRDWKDLWEKYQAGDAYAIHTLTDDASVCWEVPMSNVTAEQLLTIVDDFEWCWQNWPTQLGAPFIDRNGDGVYTPPPLDYALDDLINLGYDEPGIAGVDTDLPADQVIWAVWNDLHRMLYFASEPTGIEVQMTLWGYARTDALGNSYFRKFRVINKGGVEIDAAGNKGVFFLDSMYFCQWSDPDLGQAGDDLAGCDTVLNMGYAYNKNAIDLLYREFGLPPPAVGYDIVQGPAIYTGDPGDVAVFDLKRRQGYKNLGMTAFTYEAPGDPYSTPGGGYDRNAVLWYKMYRGYAPFSFTNQDVRYNHPPGVKPGPFPMAGDPVKGTGHIDGLGTVYSFVAGDKRIFCSSGPFQMAPGDTQEIVVALVCGLGSDRLSSISVMKHNDRYIQSVYSSLLSFPVPPKSPSVKIAEMDGKVILEWGSDSKSVFDIEEKMSGLSGFRFEGYNVYQLPSATSGKSEAVRIATYDRLTDPAVVLEEIYDSASGQVLLVPAQFGSNCGVRREFVFDRDYVRDIDKLYNGTEYYLAVTAYSVPTSGFFTNPTFLESTLRPVKVVPQSRGFGVVMGSEHHQTIEPVVHTAGTGSAEITPIVIDPFSIVPATYTVSWDPDSTWKVSKEGTTLVDGQTNTGGDEIYPIVDGVMVKVKNVTFTPPLDFTKCTIIPQSNEDNYQIIRIVGSVGTSARVVATRGYGTTDLALLQCDIELRFTGVYGDKEGSVIPIASGGQMATIYKANTMADHPLNPNPGSDERFVLRIPFEVWDVERNMQINIIMRDRIQQTTDDPFYAFNPNDRVYVYLNALPYKETVITESDEAQNTWTLILWKTQWQTGDVIRIEYSNPIIPGSDEFTYSTHGYENTVNDDLKKRDVRRIGVFPNPYYAFNPLEKNKFDKFVTFNNLPTRASIRIFTLSGHLVRHIDKDDESKFAQWDLRNHYGFQVASGLYIVHISIPDEGLSTILKLAVIQEEEFLDVY